jgi:hypothetical protein
MGEHSRGSGAVIQHRVSVVITAFAFILADAFGYQVLADPPDQMMSKLPGPLELTSPATTQDRMQAANVAVRRMAEETLECAAYFDVVSLALLNSNASETAQEYINARKLAVDRAESLSQGILSARYNDFIHQMTNSIVIANVSKHIDQNLSNVAIEDISVLRDRYAKSCKQVVDNPGARAKYWMEPSNTQPH